MLRVEALFDQRYRFAVVDVSATDVCVLVSVVELLGVMTGVAGAVSIVTVFGADSAEQFADPDVRTL